MQAKFTRAEESRLGIRFEPESFEEQLLLEAFASHGSPGGCEFRFSSWEQNHPRQPQVRDGLTACWGQLVRAGTMRVVDDGLSRALEEAGVGGVVRERGLAAAIEVLSEQESRLARRARELESELARRDARVTELEAALAGGGAATPVAAAPPAVLDRPPDAVGESG